MKSSGKVLTPEELAAPDTPKIFLAVGRERDLDMLYVLGAPAGIARVVRGQRCPDKIHLFQEWAAAFQFPYYFGHNWDAWHECIRDLDWMRSDTYITIISNVDQVLAGADKDFRSFVSLLEKSAAEWQERIHERNAVFKVIYHSERETASAAVDRLTAADSNFEMRELASASTYRR